MTFPFPFIPPGAKSALFVGVTAIRTTTSAITWPSGTAAGDIAIAIGAGNSAFSISGWTAITGDTVNNSPTQSTFAYKVLVAGDISSPPTITVPTSGSYYIVVYRGATAAAKKTTASSSTTSVTATGFTKAATSRMVIAHAVDRDPSGALSTPPTGFTHRASGTSTYFSHGIYDLPASAYAGGSVTATLWSAGLDGRLTLLELTA